MIILVIFAQEQLQHNVTSYSCSAHTVLPRIEAFSVLTTGGHQYSGTLNPPWADQAIGCALCPGKEQDRVHLSLLTYPSKFHGPYSQSLVSNLSFQVQGPCSQSLVSIPVLPSSMGLAAIPWWSYLSFQVPWALQPVLLSTEIHTLQLSFLVVGVRHIDQCESRKI